MSYHLQSRSCYVDLGTVKFKEKQQLLLPFQGWGLNMGSGARGRKLQSLPGKREREVAFH